MTNFDARLSVLGTIHTSLHRLVNDPPKMRTNVNITDIGQIATKLEELEVYWGAYVSISKIESDSYAVRNMMMDEREKYLACVWWRTLLRAAVKEAHLS